MASTMACTNKKEAGGKRGFRYTFRPNQYAYDESLVPNHVHLWLALSLPADTLDGACAPLKIHIPDTLIYGFGKNPIWLFTDVNGDINKKLNEECSEENIFTSFSGAGIVALDKEPGHVSYVPPNSEFDAPPVVTFEGTYTTALNAPNLRRLLLKPRQHPPRVFAIQRVVPTKYGDHSTVVRISYSHRGKSAAWAMTRNAPFITKSASAAKLNSPQGDDADGATSMDSPGKSQIAGNATYANTNRGGAHSPELLPRSPTVQFNMDGGAELDRSASKPLASHSLRRTDTAQSAMSFNFNSLSFRQMSSFRSIDPGSPSSQHRQSVSEQNIEDITNLYDDNLQASADEPRRFLDVLSDSNCTIHEVMPQAAEPMQKIAVAISKHLSHIFHRKMEELTIDVTKDANDHYCLVDIVAYKFENGGTAPVKLPARVMTRIELECECILDPFRSHLGRGQAHAAASSESAHKERGGSKHKDVDWTALAVGASPCSMCESKLPPDQLCYAITSTLIQSTIVHMRSRLPQKYWPNFCRDSCYAIRSLLRTEGDPFDVKALTVADIRICSLCYEICNKEMALIEIEQKLSTFTRTAKGTPPLTATGGTKASTVTSTAASAKQTNPDGLSRTDHTPALSNWNPTENFRLRNRPSVLVKYAASEERRKLEVSKSEPKLSNGYQVALNSPVDRTASPSATKRPVSANIRRSQTHLNTQTAPEATMATQEGASPVRTSPICRRPPPNAARNATNCPQSPTRSKADVLSPSKSMKSFRTTSAAPPPPTQEAFLPARGRGVVRSSLSENMTMCRMLVGIQQVKDLPTIIFEHFTNFNVSYTALGRDVSFPAVKKSKYYRKSAYRYKTFTLDIGNDSMSLSSGGSGEGSDFESDGEGMRRKKKSRGSGMLSKVSEEDLAAGEESSKKSFSSDSEEEDATIVVGTLAVQRMRVAYALIPGDSANGAASPELDKYFSINRRILVVLCGDVKEGVDIHDSNRWLSPPEGFSSADKIKNLQHSLTNIRLDAVNKSLFQGQKYSGSNNLRQKHLARLFRKSNKDTNVPVGRVRTTERGEPLPDGAIAYGYVNYHQFLNATVNRIDIVTPMTYALSHVPIERSVPMLKAVIGFERLHSPVDKLSLPYSLVNVGHSLGYEAYVAELEDQLSSSEPLPAEWLVSGTVDDTSSSRRRAATNLLQSKSMGESFSMMMSGSKLDMESDVLQNVQATEMVTNLIDGKRTAPVLFQHGSRLEQKAHENRSEKVKKFAEEEEIRERNPNSLWCFSVHMVSGHHFGPTIPEYISENSKTLHWKYKFKFLGETIFHDLITENKNGFDEVLEFSSLTKHYFLGEVSALENMFANMNPIEFDLKLMEGEETTLDSSVQKVFLKPKVGARRNKASSIVAIPDEKAFAQHYTGTFNLNELEGQRFVESTLLLKSQVDVGAEKSIYPPYVFAEFHFFRMGGGGGGTHGVVPSNLVVGKEVVQGIRRVLKKNKLLKSSSFVPAP